MAHVIFVIGTRNVDTRGDVLSEQAVRSLIQQLEEKYGNGSVKVHNGNVKVAVEGPHCICGNRDCFGPEHKAWCPLWNETFVEIEEENEN